MVSKRLQRIELPVRRAEAARVVAEAVTGLGWALDPLDDGSIEVREDTTRLHCHCSPLRARISLTDLNEAVTTAEIEGRVPGRGPVAAKHVREQTDLLTRSIGLRAIRR